jgi:hypothetical protein
MSPDEYTQPLCLCCEEKPAEIRDGDIGDVCVECSVMLAVAHSRIIETPGIKSCAEVQRSRR